MGYYIAIPCLTTKCNVCDSGFDSGSVDKLLYRTFLRQLIKIEYGLYLLGRALQLLFFYCFPKVPDLTLTLTFIFLLLFFVVAF